MQTPLPGSFAALPPLHALRAFEAAARHGSFQRAAEELSVTPAAISQAIALLERRTGLHLFVRRVRQVSLTPQGSHLALAAQQALQILARCLRDLAPPASVVRVSAPPTWSAMWLMPRLSRLTDHDRDLQLQVDASVSVVDLASGDFDFAVRYASRKDATTRKCRLFAQEYVPVASSRVARRLRSTSDLRKVRLLHEDDGERWRGWLRHAGQLTGKELSIDPAGGLFFSQGTLALMAASQGLGVALAEPAFAQAAVSRKELKVLFGLPPWPTGHAYHAVWMRQREPSRATRRVIEWLQEISRRPLDH
jgi:LysR family transcriptional regulator, glycine cleavage system transcriptional activator